MLSVEKLEVLGAPPGPPLLRDVSWHLGCGERLVVSGASGSGKSVMLRAIVGLVRARGEVRLDGRPLWERPAAEVRADVVYLPQTPVRLGGTVEDNLRAIRGLAAVAARAAPWDRVLGWARALGIEALLGEPADRISGGEAQRMGLLRALQVQPRVLLADEPTSALDPEGALAVEALLREWSADRGLVWVAHDPEQAERLAARRLVVGGGTVTRP